MAKLIITPQPTKSDILDKWSIEYYELLKKGTKEISRYQKFNQRNIGKPLTKRKTA